MATLLIIGIIVVAGIFLYFMTVNLMQENQPEEVEFGTIVVKGMYRGFVSGWLGSGWATHLYWISDTKRTWDEAYNDCLRRNSHLVTFEGEYEHNTVYNWVQQKHPNNEVWIGLYQRPDGTEPDRGWSWITGEELSYVKWYPGQPDEATGVEDVGGMGWNGFNDFYRWCDYPGSPSPSLYYVCERFPIEFTLTNKTGAVLDLNAMKVELYLKTNGGWVGVYMGGIRDKNIVIDFPDNTRSFEVIRWRCDVEKLSPGRSTTCRAVMLPTEPHSFGPYKLCVEIEHYRACDVFGGRR